MKVGDLVRAAEGSLFGEGWTFTGIILEFDVNMWGEEVIPTGVKVMWEFGEVEFVYEDELEVYTRGDI